MAAESSDPRQTAPTIPNDHIEEQLTELQRQATILLRTRQVPAAVQCYRHAVETSKQLHNSARTAKISAKLAHALLAIDVEEAITLLREAIEHLSPESFAEDRASACRDLATALARFRKQTTNPRADLHEAVDYYKQALTIYENLDAVEAAYLCDDIGASLQRLDDGGSDQITDAVDYHKKALRLFQESTGQRPQGVLLNLGKALVTRYNKYDIDGHDPREDIVEAVRCLEEVVQRRSPTENLGKWINAVHALAEAYRAFSWEEPGQILQATKCYESVAQRCPSQFIDIHVRNQLELATTLIETFVGDVDACYERAVQCAREAVQLCGSEKTFLWAKAIFTLAWSLRCYAGVDYLRVAELKESIILYRTSLGAFKEREMKFETGVAYMALGVALRNLPSGNSLDNCREAITSQKKALEYLSMAESPVEWASANLNLGGALQALPDENLNANVLEALTCYENAGLILTRKKQPVEWARLQVNIGVANFFRTDGDRFQNLEVAVTCSRKAYELRKELGMTIAAAQAAKSLANALQERVGGDRIQNIEEAVQLYEESSLVLIRSRYPKDWGVIQMNLGVLYGQKYSGDIIENQRRGIEYLKAALEVRSRADSPAEYASVKRNLGNAYRRLVIDDRQVALTESIQHLEDGLSVTNVDERPIQWAHFQNALACSHLQIAELDLDRIENDPSLSSNIALESYMKRVRQAEVLLESGLRKIVGEQELILYAAMRMNLAWVLLTKSRYANTHEPQTSGILEQAVTHAQYARSVFSAFSASEDYVQALWIEARVLNVQNRRAEAEELLVLSVKALGDIQNLSDAGVLHSRLLAEKYSKLYSLLFEIYATKNETLGKALEICERAKASHLRDLIAVKLDVGALLPDEEARYKFYTARNEIQRCKYLLDQLPFSSEGERTRLKEEIETNKIFIEECIKQTERKSGRSQGLGKVLPWEELISCTDPMSIVTVLFFSNNYHHGHPRPMNSVYVLTIWKRKITATHCPMRNPAMEDLSQCFRDGQNEVSSEETAFLEELGNLLSAALTKAISEHQNSPFPRRLIVVPHLGLHKIPFTAVPINQVRLLAHFQHLDRCTLGDLFSRGVIILPSLSVGYRLGKEDGEGLLKSGNLMAVTGPGISKFEHLTSRITDPTAKDALVSLKGEHLRRRRATRNHLLNNVNIPSCSVFHISGHGHFGLSSKYARGEVAAAANPSAIVETSGVDLNDHNGSRALFTLRDIWGLKLYRCRLAVVVTCSGGVLNNLSTSDECLSIGYSFLAAGARCVVCSLWPVEETVAAIIMHRFYENLGGVVTSSHYSLDSVAGCLAEAQSWYRRLSGIAGERQLREYMKKVGFRDGSLPLSDRESFYNWAAFQVIGATRLDVARNPVDGNQIRMHLVHKIGRFFRSYFFDDV